VRVANSVRGGNVASSGTGRVRKPTGQRAQATTARLAREVRSRTPCGMPVRLRESDRWRRSVPFREPPGHGGTVDDSVHQAPLTATRSPTASPLALSFQTPDLGLQVAIGQLFGQETEQRTEQPGLFQ
jgi:hypothetical protein